MFEYGVSWPLWETGAEDGPPMEPADYGLSPDLTERLRAANRFWQEHFHHDRGWDSPEHLAAWTTDTRQALAILRREVAGFADVVDERDV